MAAFSPVHTVGDQVIEAIRVHQREWRPERPRVSRREARQITVDLFRDVGIAISQADRSNGLITGRRNTADVFISVRSAACDEVLGRQLRRITVPKRFGLPMRDLIMLQPRFERRSGRRALRLLEHPKFRAAFDLLLLRAAAGEADPELAQWWTRLQEIPEQERIAEVEGRPVEPGEAPKRRRPRSRRRRSRTPAA